MIAIGAQMVAGQSKICANLPKGPSERCTIILTEEGSNRISQLKQTIERVNCPGFKDNIKFDDQAGTVTSFLPKGTVDSVKTDPSFANIIKSAKC